MLPDALVLLHHGVVDQLVGLGDDAEPIRALEPRVVAHRALHLAARRAQVVGVDFVHCGAVAALGVVRGTGHGLERLAIPRHVRVAARLRHGAARARERGVRGVKPRQRRRLQRPRVVAQLAPRRAMVRPQERAAPLGQGERR